MVFLHDSSAEINGMVFTRFVPQEQCVMFMKVVFKSSINCIKRLCSSRTEASK
jgi:hypothetical protein